LLVLDRGVELLARGCFGPVFRAANGLLSAMSRSPPPLRDVSLGSSGGQCPGMSPGSAASKFFNGMCSGLSSESFR
jgi:hypothetical protein